MSKSTILTKVIIPCRFSYLNCFEAASVNGGDAKYSVSAIIKKDDIKTINEIKAAIEAAKNIGISKWGDTFKENLVTPMKDGDIEYPEEDAYNNCYFINAYSKEPPQVVDYKVQPILDKNEVYSGCYGKVSITFYSYNTNGSCGIAAGLGNLQKLRDGIALTARASATDEFEAVEDYNDFLA